MLGPLPQPCASVYRQSYSGVRRPGEINMNWDAIGASAELLAAFGVIGSLAFVGYQIRQNTRALKAAALREVLRDMADATKQLSEDPSLARIWWEGLADMEALTKDEQRRFAAYAANMCRYFENVLYETSVERLDPEQWHGLRESLRMQVRQPGFIVWWQGDDNLPGASNIFNQELQSFIREMINDDA